jgi:hypothetical protein
MKKTQTYTELFDANKLAYIIANKQEFENHIKTYNDWNPFLLPSKYLDSSLDNKVDVTYDFAKGSNNGRLFAKKSLSLQSFCKEIRNCIAKDFYDDIDIVNCHPTILQNICKKNNIKCKKLELYVKNRDKIINDLLKLNKTLDKTDIKTVILSLLNGGSSGYFKIKQRTKWLLSFKKEVDIILDSICSQNETEFNLYKPKKDYNKKGSFVNSLLCIKENEILQTMIKYFKVKENDNVVLCFDGIMLEKGIVNKKKIKKCEDIIKYECDIVIKLKIKEMEQFIKIPSDIPIYKPKYEVLSYDKVKEKFERNHFKLNYPFGFCKEFYEEIVFYNNRDFSGVYNNHYYYKLDKSSGKLKKCNFYQEWIKDENIRTFDKMDFIPSLSDCPKNIYNLFTGLEINNKKNVVIYDETKIDLILKHINILTGKHTDSFNYFIKWLAQIVQEPDKLSRTAIVFVSEEGCGKNIFLDFFGNHILGKKYYISTENMNTVFGKFAENLKNRLLVNLNEASGKDSFNLSESIKSTITDPTIDYEQKGIQNITLNNYARFIFTSNNNTPVKIGNTDRRFNVFKSSCDHIKLKDKYFGPLVKCMNDIEVQQIFYQYLMNIDIKGFNFEAQRPITELYKDIQLTTKPKIVLFIEHLLNNHKLKEEYKSSILFKSFQDYLITFGFGDYKTNITKYGRSIKLIDGIEKKKSYCIKIYIDKKKVLKYLKNTYDFEEPPEQEDNYMFRSESDSELELNRIN